jgi:hypothetical protein
VAFTHPIAVSETAIGGATDSPRETRTALATTAQTVALPATVQARVYRVLSRARHAPAKRSPAANSPVRKANS